MTTEVSTGCDVCPHENTAHAMDDGRCLILDCTCERWREPTMTFPLLYDEESIRCMDCARLMHVGEPYSSRLESIDDGMPVVTLICVYCALREAPHE